MATRTAARAGDIFLIKVTLLGMRPPIWRRLVVPGSMTLEKLHRVIQIAMGWEDYHLHEFAIGDERYGPPDPDGGFMDMQPAINEKSVRVAKVLGGVGARGIYTYDFGDSWDHQIVVERVTPELPGIQVPMCVDGERKCPPEDCGGPPGFYDLLEALGNPRHPEHKSMLEWVGGAFDPEEFSADSVNQQLKPRAKRRA